MSDDCEVDPNGEVSFAVEAILGEVEPFAVHALMVEIAARYNAGRHELREARAEIARLKDEADAAEQAWKAEIDRLVTQVNELKHPLKEETC